MLRSYIWLHELYFGYVAEENISSSSVEPAMRLIGGRWRILLVLFLLGGPKRFNHLKRDVPNISPRTLKLDLRALEEAGLVLRTIYSGLPTKVEYSLTAEGQELRNVVETLQEFGLRWKQRRHEAGD